MLVCFFFALLAVFYVPFILNIDPATQSYWQGRLAGTGGKLSSSRYLFTVYQPIYVVHIYTILFVLGVASIFKSFLSLNLLKKTVLKKQTTARRRHSTKFLWVLPLLKAETRNYIVFFLWFFIPFLFFEGVVSIPGTHIYVYLLPVFIFLGLGINFLRDLAVPITKKYTHQLFALGIAFVFLFIFAQSYAVFVDNKFEYPWESEKFLLWEFPQPSPIYHLSMFGFPYYRNWDSIGDFVENGEALIPCPTNKDLTECPFKVSKIRFYSTNERKSIARYHILFNKDTNNAGYFVFIRKPQSFTDEILHEKALYWSKNYDPVFVVEKCVEDTFVQNVKQVLKPGLVCSKKKVVANVYYMVNGDLDRIRNAGF